MEPDETAYNNDILVHINSAIMTLTQLGVGPKDGFIVADEMQHGTILSVILSCSKGLSSIFT